MFGVLQFGARLSTSTNIIIFTSMFANELAHNRTVFESHCGLIDSKGNIKELAYNSVRILLFFSSSGTGVLTGKNGH